MTLELAAGVHDIAWPLLKKEYGSAAGGKMHMRNRWKMFTWMITAAALVVSFAGSGLAAEADTSHYSDDRRLAYIGIARIAKTTANAIDMLSEEENDPEHYYQGFARIPFTNPDKMVIVHLDPVQSRLAREGLQVESNQEIAPALAEFINVQFSEEYARQAAKITPDPFRGEEIGETDLVILPYGSDIAVCCEGQSALIMSTRDISSALSESDITAYTEQLGIEDPKIRVYEKENMGNLDLANNWAGSGYESSLRDAIIANPNRFERMFPELIGSPNVNDRECVSVLYYYLRQNPSFDQVHTAAEIYLPAIAAAGGYESAFECLDGSCDSITDNDFEFAQPVDFDFGETGEEDRKFEKDDTFLFVVKRGYADEEIEGVPEEHEDAEVIGVPVLDLISEVFLPPRAIPGTMEEADYIILCDITWGPDHYKSNGHTLIYPNTHIAIYDVKTGEMVRDLGTRTRELRGMTMVSSDIVYYVPLRSLIFEQLQPVLQEIEASK